MKLLVDQKRSDGKGGWSQSRRTLAYRRLAPLLLIPAGAAYCLLFELFFESIEPNFLRSIWWAVATLAPWVVAAFAFEKVATFRMSRSRLVLIALGLGVIAYLLSAGAALALDAGTERAFFSRLPLLAAALLFAWLYPMKSASTEGQNIVPAGDKPPVPTGDILFACAAGNYIELHTAERTVIWRQTMSNAERVLKSAGFVRVHRSYMVPWRNIDVLVRDRKGVVEVELQNGRRLPVSSRYAPMLSQHTVQ